MNEFSNKKYFAPKDVPELKQLLGKAKMAVQCGAEVTSGMRRGGD